MVGEPTLPSGRHVEIDSRVSNVAEREMTVDEITRREPIMKLVPARSEP